MLDKANEVPQAGNMSKLEEVRAGYRESLGQIKSTRREFLKRAAQAAGAVALGATGLPLLSTPAEAGGGLEHVSGLKRESLIRAMPGNERASIWENYLGDKYREIFKSVISSATDLTYEFNPKEVDPTWRFFDGWLYRQSSDNSAFLDNSGRAVAGGLDKIIDSLPSFRPLVYQSADRKKSPFANHALVITKDVMPGDGYVMVFSRPDKPERPDAFYDRWELDTSVASDTVKTKGGHKGQHTLGEGYFLVINTEDRTDRFTPFYNKDNPANVEKVVVLFDSNGQAVSKFNLDKTEFYPRQDWMDNYEGNKLAQKYEVGFLDWYRLPRAEQQARMESYNDKFFSLVVDTEDLRLHVAHDNLNDKILHLNIDPSKEPLPAYDPRFKNPIEVWMDNEDYEILKKRWKTEGGNTLPDLVVPKGVKLVFWANQTRLGFRNESRRGLVYHSFVSPNPKK